MRADLPNLLSGLRLLLVPVLWLLAFANQRVAQALLLFVAGFTDVLDGYLARRMHRASHVGSRLDTAADFALLGSIYVWILLLSPDVVWDRRWFVVALLLLTVMFLIIGWARFRRLADLHIYSAKAAG